MLNQDSANELNKCRCWKGIEFVPLKVLARLNNDRPTSLYFNLDTELYSLVHVIEHILELKNLSGETHSGRVDISDLDTCRYRRHFFLLSVIVPFLLRILF
jgi:hypothetical protein